METDDNHQACYKESQSILAEVKEELEQDSESIDVKLEPIEDDFQMGCSRLGGSLEDRKEGAESGSIIDCYIELPHIKPEPMEGGLELSKNRLEDGFEDSTQIEDVKLVFSPEDTLTDISIDIKEEVNRVNEEKSKELSLKERKVDLVRRRSNNYCKSCGVGFRDKQHLTMHNRILSGERPYSCENCAKTFVRKDHLIVHQRIHTGEKRFPCEFCDQSYARKDHLLKHLKKHSKGVRNSAVRTFKFILLRKL